jgi:hypothetical protein
MKTDIVQVTSKKRMVGHRPKKLKTRDFRPGTTMCLSKGLEVTSREYLKSDLTRF